VRPVTVRALSGGGRPLKSGPYGDHVLLPDVETLLIDPRLDGAVGRLGRAMVREAVAAAAGVLPADEVVPHVLARLPAVPATLRPVLNATGQVVRADLGGAPLSVAARAAVLAAAGTADVALDLASGEPAPYGRGAVEALLTAVPAAGDALVVASAEAALVLAAVALAPAGEIAVQFTGAGSGAGAGMNADAGADAGAGAGAGAGADAGTGTVGGGDAGGIVALLGGVGVRVVDGVRPGAAVVVTDGAVPDVAVPVVVVLRRGLPAASAAVPGEPDAASALAAGAGLVIMPGDGLLGGPAAGLVLGRAEPVARLRAHPLAAALRVGKLTLAALEATLRGPATPVARFLSTPAAAVRARADRLAALLSATGVDATVLDTVASGFPSAAVSLPAAYARALRTGDPAVLGRVEGDRCLLDLRTVEETDDRAVQRAVLAVRP
jgi:L-seryl-tRNA(Ser) seleniumtransferase